MVPPSPCEAASTLSVVILRISRNSAALPDCSVCATSFMNLSLIPTSANAPPSAPAAAPSATPPRDHEDETDQQASERARGGASSSGMEDLVELDPTVRLLDGDDSIAEFDQIKSLYSP